MDQSFVHEIDTADGTDEATIIRAVINMGGGLKYRVIAEAVETAAQLRFLQAHGCDQAQGFYFSQQLPASQFAKLMEAGVPAGLPN